jgi:hypothetical protein
MFVSKNWPIIWDSHVKGKPHYGDFVILIEGPSNPDKLKQWVEDENFLVTPNWCTTEVSVTANGLTV